MRLPALTSPDLATRGIRKLALDTLFPKPWMSRRGLAPWFSLSFDAAALVITELEAPQSYRMVRREQWSLFSTATVCLQCSSFVTALGPSPRIQTVMPELWTVFPGTLARFFARLRWCPVWGGGPVAPIFNVVTQFVILLWRNFICVKIPNEPNLLGQEGYAVMEFSM